MAKNKKKCSKLDEEMMRIFEEELGVTFIDCTPKDKD